MTGCFNQLKIMMTTLIQQSWTPVTTEAMPEWLTQLKQAATERFAQAGYPTMAHESWRYMDLTALLNTSFGGEASSTRPETQFEDAAVSTLYYHNDSIEGSDDCRQENGIIFSRFSSLSPAQIQALQPVLDHEQEEPSPLAWINLSQWSDAVVLSVPEGVKAEQAYQVSLSATGTAQHPHVMINLDADAEATLYITADDASSAHFLQNLVVTANVADRATLHLHVLNLDDTHGYRFDHVRVRCHTDSQLYMTMVSKGGNQVRHDIKVDFLGEGAHSELNGVALLSGTTQVFTHTNMNHLVPRCTSEQRFKNILTQQSRSEYNGLVYVKQHAQETDSSQHNQNLLLSDDARALSRPQLEIFADDVKCAHGATVGQLNEDEIFYLQSRGLSKEAARSVLLHGFIEEVVHTLPDSSFREVVQQWVDTHLTQFQKGAQPWS